MREWSIITSNHPRNPQQTIHSLRLAPARFCWTIFTQKYLVLMIHRVTHFEPGTTSAQWTWGISATRPGWISKKKPNLGSLGLTINWWLWFWYDNTWLWLWIWHIRIMIWLLSLSWYNWWYNWWLEYKSGWESSQLDNQKSQLAQLSTRIASSTVGAHHCWTFLGHLGLRENLEKWQLWMMKNTHS